MLTPVRRFCDRHVTRAGELLRPPDDERARVFNVSLLGKLKAAKAELEMPEDPWLAPLQRVRGKVEFDGMERVSSQTLLDVVAVPQRSRTAGTYRRLAKVNGRTGLDGCTGSGTDTRWLSRAGQGLLPRCTIPFEPKKPTLTLQRS